VDGIKIIFYTVYSLFCYLTNLISGDGMYFGRNKFAYEKTTACSVNSFYRFDYSFDMQDRMAADSQRKRISKTGI